ncbi:MAG: dual-specificity RNA methyltransferase RlmN [Lysobacteraceae bacterium]|nr:MAG: dual-specificity RNA methyltransferase RlmN [Xanthomonadaceae bacterium]
MHLPSPMIQSESKEQMVNLFDLDRKGLQQWFADQGEKPFRADQIMKWVYHRGITDFAAMTDLSKSLREKLQSLATLTPPEILSEQRSSDGTVKWLIGFGGKNAVETVFIPEPKRGTLCVSSQVGCVLNCRFCSTGTQGFSRNLSTAEIIGQVWLAAQALGHNLSDNRQITNVVMMGMGEPLLNLDSVAPALSLMRDDLAFGLASKRVTVSTAGLVPGIDKLRETVDVALAVSLHAPDDKTRTEIVPLNKKYPIDVLLESCRRYLAGKHKARVTFEYTMLDGVNDSLEQARLLAKRLANVPAKVNLIPFNPFPGADYKCSSGNRIRAFQEVLMQAGLVATVRKTRGQDIDAACGQLVGQVMDRSRRQREFKAKLASLPEVSNVA